ncbi:zinc-binding alcohol dehydrogenase family protein [Chenggangzhangella methanolivorans]|uniref:Zinc-type alcohol dehydrogenase-like protein n=1 Tax=Chenggangzhangella methanolivorans TaxID=1437009 RepID=A0A9E6UMH4_9HYPH|nr:zinc-binding alcohol dehydrogenase family protein [Chenggangzhangella methanolivorans]QZO01682.1 zinc-binding alcohol dehydrogenase family protein [Chenggangzhangella methanolivorans]
MKAVGFYKSLPAGDPNSLVDVEIAKPEPKPRDLIVKVQAISVNPVDVKMRGRLAPAIDVPHVLGYDAVGIVESTGSDAKLFKPGDAVFYAGAIDRPGANSEFHAVDERIVGPAPKSLTPEQAAALPLTSLTAWELLFDRLRVPYGRMATGDAILIVNGAGGVGSILTQIARRLTGLTVIATASRPETERWCFYMGAHHVIDHRKPLDQGLREIGIPEVRYVAGLTASDLHRDAIVAALAPQGALAMIDDPESFDVTPFKRKSLSVHWELMFTRSLFGTADIEEQHKILSEVSSLVDAGVLRTTLREEMGRINAANLRRAHVAQESARSIGKTILSGF